MKPRSTPVRIGLAVVVLVAGMTAVAANFGILAAHRTSPEVGVLSATDLSATPASAPATTAARTTRSATTAPATTVSRRHEDGRRHDGDSDADD